MIETSHMGPLLRRPLGVYVVVSILLLLIKKTGFYPHILIPFLLLYLPFFLIRKEKRDLKHFGLEPRDWGFHDLTLVLKTSLVVLLPYVFFQQIFVGGGGQEELASVEKIFSLILIELFLVSLPEEVFFRGYLQTHLEDVFPKRFRLLGASFGFGMILTAALFVLSHFLLTRHLFSLAVFFPALVFGWLKERTGKVVAPAVFHALANIIYFLIPFYL
jgi:membrane protease YdiL (CAAX protease family)